MKMFLYYLLIAFVGFWIAYYFSWPKWTVFIFMVIACIVMLGRMLYVLYGTKNIKSVEKFLANNRKEPIYAFVYEQANGTKEEQLTAIEQILKKYPKGYIYQNYRFVREMLKENFDVAFEEANLIEKEPFMSYSKALVYATYGNRHDALSFELSKEWMKEAILATLAKRENDNISYEEHKQNAIQSAGGIQRYGLIHSL
ncbi:hypothetical protein [Ureibacillus acetophenoni]|uniref:Uncharacterized protein n=1 Tax=Ureibacillus acetophenoni TaxID=614649 RepID=A0A285U3Y6_9BACL|nr:hypothetical protein [Ureibacillus acetophenoni]SOC36138.1 hypothetical protein SAMN05877842_102119 [Ureibacillus acetophenoni]